MQQKWCQVAFLKNQIIKEELDKLLVANFVQEVHYPTWLANVVVMPKKNGKWRMCVDYTNQS